MALNLEMEEVRLSAESGPSGRGPVVKHDALEAVVTNRRRALIGIAVSCALLLGAIVWQYVDDQGAFPTPAETGQDGPVIGSISVEADGSNP